MAHAHADPTIHYLETQNLVASVGLPATQNVELQLLGLVQAIDRRGYPIKVSVIANETDTGGESEPLADPQEYAELVVRELELFFEVEAPVVIVTPNGFGVAGKHVARRAARSPSPAATAGRSSAGSRCRRWKPTRSPGRRCSRSGSWLAPAGRPLPEHVPAAKALAPQPRAGAASSEGVDTWVWSLVLGSIPLLAWALYALWSRGSRQ